MSRTGGSNSCKDKDIAAGSPEVISRHAICLCGIWAVPLYGDTLRLIKTIEHPEIRINTRIETYCPAHKRLCRLDPVFITYTVTVEISSVVSGGT